jgi:hypothetical protein
VAAVEAQVLLVLMLEEEKQEAVLPETHRQQLLVKVVMVEMVQHLMGLVVMVVMELHHL